MISAERTKEIFLGLKLHYKSSYDFVKYRGRLRKQPDKPEAIYTSIANKYVNEDKVTQFMVSHIVGNYESVGKIPSIMITYDPKIYNKWLGNFKKLSYMTQSYLSNVDIKKKILDRSIIDDYKDGLLTLDQFSIIISFFKNRFENLINPLDEELIKISDKHIKILDHLEMYDRKNFYQILKKELEKNINKAYHEQIE